MRIPAISAGLLTSAAHFVIDVAHARSITEQKARDRLPRSERRGCDLDQVL
jgi:hypothetical protein